MRRTYWTLLLATTLAGAGLLTAACGGDDSAGGGGNKEAGTEGGPGFEAGPQPEGGNPEGGGPDGGCTFATYVIGLITTSTNATAKPDPSLGAGCKDTTTQAEFKSLF